MATWESKYTQLSAINGGNKYTTDSQLTIDMFIVPIENADYAVQKSIIAEANANTALTRVNSYKITFNGNETTQPSFYAPTSGGTSGQILKSNGTSAPTWVNQSDLSVGSATKATQDSDGKPINTTYLKTSGGKITGELTFDSGASITTKGYVKGTYLYTSKAYELNDLTKVTQGVAILSDGFIYYRTLNNLKNDLGLPALANPKYYMHNIQAVLTPRGSSTKYYVAFQVVSTSNTTYGTSTLSSAFSGKSFACSGMYGENLIYLITINSSPTIYYGSNSVTTLILSSVTDNIVEIK